MFSVFINVCICLLSVCQWLACACHGLLWKSQPLEVGGSPAAVQGLNSDPQACTASTVTY